MALTRRRSCEVRAHRTSRRATPRARRHKHHPRDAVSCCCLVMSRSPTGPRAATPRRRSHRGRLRDAAGHLAHDEAVRVDDERLGDPSRRSRGRRRPPGRRRPASPRRSPRRSRAPSDSSSLNTTLTTSGVADLLVSPIERHELGVLPEARRAPRGEEIDDDPAPTAIGEPVGRAVDGREARPDDRGRRLAEQRALRLSIDGRRPRGQHSDERDDRHPDRDGDGHTTRRRGRSAASGPVGTSSTSAIDACSDRLTKQAGAPAPARTPGRSDGGGGRARPRAACRWP